MRTNLRILSTVLFFFVSVLMYAQKVSGTVQDADGAPIPFADIVNTTTNANTQSDAEGNFTIDAVNGQNLMVNYEDKTQTFAVTGTQMALKFNADSSTQTVVVQIGYGSKTKEELTGAVAVIDEKTIRDVQFANVVKGLDGSVSGLQVSTGLGQPGSGASEILIRGQNSINGNNSPLIILDGVPYNGGLSSINSKDIADISVLKDASATAIYGNRAASGVIIVTSKRGKKGNIAPNVEVDMKRGVNFRSNNRYEIIDNEADYYLAFWRILKESQMQAGNSAAVASAFASNNLIPILGYNSFNVADNLVVDNNGVVTNASLKYHDDWEDEMLGSSSIQEYYLRISGGTDKFSSAFSVGYLEEEGFAKNTYFNRFNARFSADYNPREDIAINASIGYINATQNAAGTSSSSAYAAPFDWIQNVAPIYPVYARDAAGNFVLGSNGEKLYDFGVIDDNGDLVNNGPGDYYGVRAFGGFSNPAYDLDRLQDKYINDIIDAKAQASFKFLNGFKFTYLLAGEILLANDRTYQSALGGLAHQVGGRLTVGNGRYFNLTNQQLLNYSKLLGDKHKVDVLVGHENFQRTIYNGSLQGTQFLYLDYNPYLNFAGNIDRGSVSEQQQVYETEGFFSRIDYNYDSRYYLTGSVRRDASSVFDPSVRWGTFWSVSGAWRVSNEQFMKSITWVNELKLAGGYGTQGNDYVPYGAGGRNYYAFQTQYNLTRDTTNGVMTSNGLSALPGQKDGGDGVLGYNPATGLNDDTPLEWEKRIGSNFNVDFSLFKKRVTGSINVYQNKSEDLIYFVPYWNQGVSNPGIAFNIGDVGNKGLEMDFTFGIIRKENFTFNTSFNSTFNKNEVLKVIPGTEHLYYGFNNNGIYEGAPIRNFILHEYAGVDPNTGLPLYNNYDAVTDANGDVIGITPNTTTPFISDLSSNSDRVRTGKSPNPDVYGGFNLYFDYKNVVDLSASFSYSLGGWGYDGAYQSLMTFGDSGRNYHVDALNMWRRDNTASDIPVIVNNVQNAYGNSTRFLVKRDYIALNNLTLGFNIKQDFLDSMGISGFRLYLTGQNLFIKTARKGYDPRLNGNGSADDSLYPVNSTVAVGVNIKF